MDDNQATVPQFEIGRAFRYPIQKPDWLKKSVLGFVVAFIPILNFALWGYQMRLMRHLAYGEPEPKWEDIGSLFKDGYRPALGQYVLMLPIFLIMFISYFGFIFAMVILPLVIVPMAANDPNQLGRVAPIFSLLMFGGFGFFMFGMMVMFLLLLVVSIIAPVVTVFYAREPTWASCFNYRAMLGFVRRNLASYILLLLAVVVMSYFVALIIMPLAFVPILGQIAYLVAYAIFMIYIITVMAHGLGQLLAIDLAQAPATPVLPPTPTTEPA